MSEKKKIRKINNTLIYLLILLMLATIAIFVVNVVKMKNANTGEGETLEIAPVDNGLLNDTYTIGNNPTEINQEYFRELNTATTQEEPSNKDIAQAVAKCFITEYYTWTNKDGNYDIGGMNYIISQKKDDFAEYTLFNFYADMDLYLTKYGMENLIQVKDVTVNSVTDAGTYTIQLPSDDSEVSDEVEAGTLDLTCIDVDASWTYEDNTSINTAEFQNHALFHVVDNNGRWEIAGISAQ